MQVGEMYGHPKIPEKLLDEFQHLKVPGSCHMMLVLRSLRRDVNISMMMQGSFDSYKMNRNLLPEEPLHGAFNG